MMTNIFYAVHRVNRVTGEVVRLPRPEFPAGPKKEIEIIAGFSKWFPDPDWDLRAMRDVRAELEAEGVPEPIILIVERLSHGRDFGLSDPMYMSNRVAVKFGWGDGMSNFNRVDTRPSHELVREFAREIRASYETVFDGMCLDEDAVFGRVAAGLRESNPLFTEAVVDRPRGERG